MITIAESAAHVRAARIAANEARIADEDARDAYARNALGDARRAYHAARIASGKSWAAFIAIPAFADDDGDIPAPMEANRSAAWDSAQSAAHYRDSARTAFIAADIAYYDAIARRDAAKTAMDADPDATAAYYASGDAANTAAANAPDDEYAYHAVYAAAHPLAGEYVAACLALGAMAIGSPYDAR